MSLAEKAVKRKVKSKRFHDNMAKGGWGWKVCISGIGLSETGKILLTGLFGKILLLKFFLS